MDYLVIITFILYSFVAVLPLVVLFYPVLLLFQGAMSYLIRGFTQGSWDFFLVNITSRVLVSITPPNASNVEFEQLILPVNKTATFDHSESYNDPITIARIIEWINTKST